MNNSINRSGTKDDETDETPSSSSSSAADSANALHSSRALLLFLFLFRMISKASVGILNCNGEPLRSSLSAYICISSLLALCANKKCPISLCSLQAHITKGLQRVDLDPGRLTHQLCWALPANIKISTSSERNGNILLFGWLRNLKHLECYMMKHSKERLELKLTYKCPRHTRHTARHTVSVWLLEAANGCTTA